MEEDRSFEDAENEMNKGAVWGVVYGDFMSNMMVFFLVLFSFSMRSNQGAGGPGIDESLSSIQKQFGGTTSPETLARLTRRKAEDALSSELKGMIDAHGLGEHAQVDADEKRIGVVLTAPVLFDTARAELRPEALPILEGIAAVLTKAPLTREIVVEGHTDDVPVVGGRWASNWELSAARANAVVALLVRAGVPPDRLSAAGRGEHRPAAPNDGPEGRARNRRIEIAVLR